MVWNPFKRGRGKETPAAEQQPAAPAGPAPAEAPAPKRGLLGRMFGRKPKPAPAPASKPTAPAGPPAQAPGPGPAGAAPAPAEGGEGGGGEGGEGGEAKPKRTYPGTLPVSATGTWKISSSIWYGTASGTLTGAAVRVFIDTMEDGGNEEAAIYLIAQAYDDGSGFADNMDPDGTSVVIDY
jgi:hypothetical protein